MSRNTMYASVALMLVIVIGSAGAYWGYKKIRQKQNQEYRYEGKLTAVRDGVEPETFKSLVLTDEVMEGAISKHDLVSRWGLPDVEAAKARLQQKFTVRVNGRDIIVGYQDKDKPLAQAVLSTLMQSFYQQAQAQRAGRGM